VTVPPEEQGGLARSPGNGASGAPVALDPAEPGQSQPAHAIFINYRREDSGGQARALLYALEQAFPGQVFMDVKGLRPGVNYLEEIERTVGNCRVVLVLIGRNWATLADSSGRRRLADPRDVVTLEVATALRRRDVLVIPVLVGGAALPAEQDLPEPLLGLLHRQCLQLTEQDWDYNVSQLVETLRPKVRAPVRPARKGIRSGVVVALAAAAVLLALGLAFLLGREGAPRTAARAKESPAVAEAPAAARAPAAAAGTPPPAPAAVPRAASEPPPRPEPEPQPARPRAPEAAAPPARTAQPPRTASSQKPTPRPAAERPAPAPAEDPSRAAPVAAPATARAEAAPARPAEQRASFATKEVVSFQQYLGNPEAKGRGRALVGSARWVLEPSGTFTFAPDDQAPGFFPMTVRASRDGDRVSFEGVRTAKAGDGLAYVRISGHLALGKPPPALTLDLEFGRASGSDGSDLEPTFKAQARLQLRAE